MEPMSSTQRLLARIKKLLYICFGGQWRGSEAELTDWESARRVLVATELLVGISILLVIFWPTSLYILGFSIILGSLAASGLALYKYVLRSTPEAPEIDEWHEYWKARESSSR